MAVIRFPEWRPDLPDLENPGSPLIKNVVSKTALSLGPWRRPVVQSINALDSRCFGMFSGTDYTGAFYTFVGDAGKLYRYTSATFTDVSKALGYSTAASYTDTVSRAWYFEQYNNATFATNYSDPVQAWVMGTDAAFSDMASTAPNGKYLATVGDFLVVANTDDTFDGQVPLRLWWSPIGAPFTDDWGNTNLQSDFRTLPSGRRITGIVGGEYGLIFCEQGVYRMTYAGPPTIFSIDRINVDHGCIAPGSIATMENMVFYLAEDGLQMMRDGQNQHIGNDKFDNYFFSTVDKSKMERAVAAIDDTRKLYILMYPGENATNGKPNRALAYNYNTHQCTLIEQELELIGVLQSAALTVEGLGAIYTYVEDVRGSTDSSAWSGGTEFLAGFNSTHELVEFSGDNAAFWVETPEVTSDDGSKAVVRKLRPLTDCDCATLRIGARNHQYEGVSYTEATSPNAVTGLCSFRAKGRFRRAAMEAPEGAVWTEISGVDGLVAPPAGKR